MTVTYCYIYIWILCYNNYTVSRVTTVQTMWNHALTIPWRFTTLLPMLSVTHIMPVLSVIVSGGGRSECNTAWSETKIKCTSSAKSRMDANMLLTINSFRPIFSDKIFSLTLPSLLVQSLTFLWQLSNSPTFAGFPDKWSPCVSLQLPTTALA